jgi:hypothetical protein
MDSNGWGYSLTASPVDTNTGLVGLQDASRSRAVAAYFFQGVANVLAGSDAMPRAGDDVTRNGGLPMVGVAADGSLFRLGSTAPSQPSAASAAVVAGVPLSTLLIVGLAAYLLLRK